MLLFSQELRALAMETGGNSDIPWRKPVTWGHKGAKNSPQEYQILRLVRQYRGTQHGSRTPLLVTKPA